MKALSAALTAVMIGFPHRLCSHTMLNPKAKERLQPILEEFRRGIAHHRAEGATEKRIRQILGASIWLATQQVKDPELCAWLCDEFSKAAKVALIVTNHPASRSLH